MTLGEEPLALSSEGAFALGASLFFTKGPAWLEAEGPRPSTV